jgi:hypothetical protein
MRGVFVIPSVIDNQQYRLADVLNALLERCTSGPVDVATAYFTAQGFGLLQKGLESLGNFRLLLGAEPASGEQLGIRPDPDAVKGLLRRDLEELAGTAGLRRFVVSHHLVISEAPADVLRAIAASLG